MSAKRLFLCVVAVVLTLDVALLVSGRRVLIGTKITQGWVVEGDLLYPEWEESLSKHPDKKTAQFTHCIYWSGLAVKRVVLPSETLPDGCPVGLLLPK